PRADPRTGATADLRTAATGGRGRVRRAARHPGAEGREPLEEPQAAGRRGSGLYPQGVLPRPPRRPPADLGLAHRGRSRGVLRTPRRTAGDRRGRAGTALMSPCRARCGLGSLPRPTAPPPPAWPARAPTTSPRRSPPT